MQWLSLIPALTTIFLTFKTKKLIPSLLAGVVIGSFISTRSIFNGITSIGEFIIDVLTDKDSAYTLGFLIAFGALAELIEMAGGISGFSQKVEKWAKSERGVLGWGWLLSIITFFDSSFHTIAVGTVLNPLLDKVKASREKFAFILSVTSLQLILLIPIATGYLGYMVTLVTNNIKDTGIKENAYLIVAKSVIWNFFSWSMLLIALGVTIFGFGFGKLKIGTAKNESEELTEGHVKKEQKANEAVQEYPGKARNLIIPILILLSSTIFFFWWTGKEKAPTFFGALSSADFNVSIFAGALLTILVAGVYFLFQKISLAEIEAHIIKGGEKVLSLIIILVLSWALTSVTQELGFNNLVSEGFIRSIPRFLIPAALFLISGIISYTIGSSWATWALMMPLAVAFSINTGVNITTMIGTVWAGGAVTDVVSPLSADMAKTSFGEHMVTSLPYVIAGAVISVIGYITVGLLF
ncbi:Na+/H+ antiporter NhaC family protein [Pseudobacteroides cellulosolvens]|uniref:Na+/H+ antiporter NhaC-like protein n=1 Tax=Pseudobacteroides cellulosolvens ATCC 35603 = DSM 2933 TaxID=398512 RepID=A0A0L6JIS6_9FIRM|nr:Na+/H+ antiporter NhaC family protein [Pseudobacteroides cellulosolvens]KNY25640.1 Na+/H+ antiporter NhaC-like protein [Pseudobacteroides cellulosolvens ATCC 35603 = DSM 2933]